MGNIKILSETEIRDELKKLPGWEYKDNKISKKFVFKNFLDAVAFINKAAPLFEAENHHPDMTITYNKILFELQRYDIGGKVTDVDIKTAHRLEELFREFEKK